MEPTQLETLLQYTFSDRSLLRRAFTHQSHGDDHNERLEFLGDSILSSSIATLLYERFPVLSEGGLSRVRSNLVREGTLHEIALAIKLGNYLRLGDGEKTSGGRSRTSILADAFEAVLGAIYLDGGFIAARDVVYLIYLPILDTIDIRLFGKDPKSRLQEFLQGIRLPVPDYAIVRVIDEGAGRQYESECVVRSRSARTTGIGPNRRAAEREAAQRMLTQLCAG